MQINVSFIPTGFSIRDGVLGEMYFLTFECNELVGKYFPLWPSRLFGLVRADWAEIDVYFGKSMGYWV